MGEQHLSAAHATATQLGFVHLNQTHLAHSRCRLQLVDFLGPHGPAQAFHALGHRAAADHDQLAPLLDQRGELFAPVPNRLFVQPPALVGHQARTHLDHYAARGFQHTGLIRHAIWIRHHIAHGIVRLVQIVSGRAIRRRADRPRNAGPHPPVADATGIPWTGIRRPTAPAAHSLRASGPKSRTPVPCTSTA